LHAAPSASERRRFLRSALRAVTPTLGIRLMKCSRMRGIPLLKFSFQYLHPNL
jgi:hypothetical protein